jgi:predicted kinase
VPVIIWINGGFGAGKTTLAEELHRRLPDAVVYNPEDVGLMLWKWMPPNGDFQHLPSWRELVVATALSLRRHHADTLIVRMSLIRDAYRAEILGGLADAGEQVLHVFLEVDAGVLRERLNARVTDPKYSDWDQAARELGMTGVDEMVAAAARAGRDAPAALRQAHPGRAGRPGAGQGRLAPGSPRRQADAASKIAGRKRNLGYVAHQAEPIRRTSSGARQMERCPVLRR